MDKAEVVIKMALPEEATNKTLITTLADIVNTAYTAAESDIFIPSYKRTSPSGIASYITASQLAIAYNPTGEPIGCVFVKILSPTLGQFGMLALDAKYQGTGLGKQITAFAEDEVRRQGCERMQLEILVPLTFHHEGKARMLAWYNRMGYEVVKLGDFAVDYPDLVGLLAGPTEYRILEKPLTPLTGPLSYTISSSPLLELHKSLVEETSIAGSEKPVTDFLQTYLKDAGFTVETQTVAKDRVNIFAYYKTRKTRVLVTSHLDTVPPYWPYERRGDEIWGRGSVDAKGSVAAQIIAVRDMFEGNEIWEGDVALLFVVGEEVGGDGMKAASNLGLTWESVIFGEPTELKLATGHKGGLRFTIRAKGKAGHSGYPETGSSAIDSLVNGLVALKQAKLPWSDDFGNTTINIGKIEGGIAGNVIPANASAITSVRIAAGTADEMKEFVRKVVEGSDPHLGVEFSTYAVDPVPLDHDLDGLEKIVVNYGTDIPSLKGDHKKYLYGPGSILEAHSDHEHLKVSDLENAVEGYRALISHTLQSSRN
ncbi:unnamed protein product [Fusarium equiseti]|uniref:N-acetyltransferase domain-containing protein n=1 Tax=Fusarium equiseti TaxID=61235 RepID=A0A8J2J0L1_FUSEQ|nr:unnamed protein product [Fusarium equiseti]